MLKTRSLLASLMLSTAVSWPFDGKFLSPLRPSIKYFNSQRRTASVTYVKTDKRSQFSIILVRKKFQFVSCNLWGRLNLPKARCSPHILRPFCQKFKGAIAGRFRYIFTRQFNIMTEGINSSFLAFSEKRSVILDKHRQI